MITLKAMKKVMIAKKVSVTLVLVMIVLKAMNSPGVLAERIWREDLNFSGDRFFGA